ncbi:MAG: histidine phosphatase family protein [Bulleidia sp.]|nr:histidine phosphatase family protein [Bulleidia sp.]
MKVTFWFVRHGQTLFNTDGRVQGVTDSPLTEKGSDRQKALGIR